MLRSLTNCPIILGTLYYCIDFSLTEHASVGAGGAAEPEEGEDEEEPEDGDDDEDEDEVERRRALEARLDLKVEDLLGLQQEVDTTAHDGERAALKKKEKSLETSKRHQISLFLRFNTV